MNPGVFGFPQRLRRFLTTTPPLTGGGNVSDPPPIGFDASYLRSFLAGLTLANNVGDATNDIDIALGVCVDSTGTRFIKLAAGVTRQLDAVFGVGNGGLSSSLSIANATYHTFAVIMATGVASVGFDTSVTAANLIADHGITAFRRVGSIIRTGGAITTFVQRGNIFTRNAAVLDINTAALGNSGTLFALAGVPLGINVQPLYRGAFSNAAIVIVLLTGADESDQSLGGGTTSGNAAAGVTAELTWHPIFTDTARQIRARASVASTTLTLGTYGWVDARGQDV